MLWLLSACSSSDLIAFCMHALWMHYEFSLYALCAVLECPLSLSTLNSLWLLGLLSKSSLIALWARKMKIECSRQDRRTLWHLLKLLSEPKAEIADVMLCIDHRLCTRVYFLHHFNSTCSNNDFFVCHVLNTEHAVENQKYLSY